MNTSSLAVYTGHISASILTLSHVSSHALVPGKGLVPENYIHACFRSSLIFSHSCLYLSLYCPGKGFMNDGQP